MKRLLWLAFVTVVAVSSLLAQEPSGKKQSDVEKLQGQWVAVSGQFNGKAFTESELADMAIRFKGEHLTRKPDTLLIMKNPKDPNEKPMRIDTSDTQCHFHLHKSGSA